MDIGYVALFFMPFYTFHMWLSCCSVWREKWHNYITIKEIKRIIIANNTNLAIWLKNRSVRYKILPENEKKIALIN